MGSREERSPHGALADPGSSPGCSQTPPGELPEHTDGLNWDSSILLVFVAPGRGPGGVVLCRLLGGCDGSPEWSNPCYPLYR